MLSFRCCKVFIVSLCPFPHCPCLFSTLLADQKIKREEEKRKEGEHPHYSKFLAKSYCWLFFIFALLLHCLLSCLFVATLPIRICLSPYLPASFPLYIYLYCVLGEHESFCLFPQMQFAAARCLFRKFLLRLLYRLCHFQLILHYIKHGLLQ